MRKLPFLSALLVTAAAASHALAEPLPPPQPPPPGVAPAAPAAPAQPAQAAPQPAAQPAPVTVTHARPRPGAGGDDSDGGRDMAPPPSTGFQLALRMGLAVPFGTAYGVKGTNTEASMSDTTGIHFMPLFLDIGGKLSEHFFLGAMLGFGVGSAKNAAGTAEGNLVSGVFGIELLYFISPAEKLNPWIGYGLAAEVLAGREKGTDTTVSLNGLRFADLMGGLDFRLSRTFGIGPFASLAFAQYSTLKTESNGTSREVDLDTKIHGWFTIGAKGTFFP